MGASASLSVDGFGIYDSHDQIEDWMLTLFGISEWHADPPSKEPEGDQEDDDSPVREVMYRSPAALVRDRLDIMGFGLKAAQAAFGDAVAAWVRRHQPEPGTAGEHSPHPVVELYSGLTFNAWLDVVMELVEADRRDARPNRFDPPEQRAGLSPLAAYIMWDDIQTYLGFPPADPRFLVRALLERFPPTAEVRLDLSDLVYAELLHIDPVEGGEPEEPRDKEVAVSPDRKLIILTEGSSDTRIIRLALEVLYPHLAEYVAFMDFEAANAGGGASQLAAMVKAFAGVGVAHRVVAVFDNDTAAADALRGLEKTKLPDNIKVVRLPAIDLARTYPTLGPSGAAPVDVNGVAASIELYLGADALRAGNGELTPVQWRGYNESIGRYQGEVLNKRAVQEAFFAKARRCTEDPLQVREAEWADIKAVVEAILRVFDGADGTVTVQAVTR